VRVDRVEAAVHELVPDGAEDGRLHRLVEHDDIAPDR
jgi:hypothetical protein